MRRLWLQPTLAETPYVYLGSIFPDASLSRVHPDKSVFTSQNRVTPP